MLKVTIFADVYVLRNKKKVLTSHEYPVTKIEEIRDVIQALDGDLRTMVSFFTQGLIANLCVSGGNEGRYLVTVTEENDGVDASYTLLNEKHQSFEEGDEVSLVTGGQEVILPKVETVDLKTAMEAAVYWAKHEKKLPSVIWRRDL